MINLSFKKLLLFINFLLFHSIKQYKYLKKKKNIFTFYLLLLEELLLFEFSEGSASP